MTKQATDSEEYYFAMQDSYAGPIRCIHRHNTVLSAVCCAMTYNTQAAYTHHRLIPWVVVRSSDREWMSIDENGKEYVIYNKSELKFVTRSVR